MDRNELKRYRKYKAALNALDLRIKAEYNTYKSPQFQSDGSASSSDPGDPVARAFYQIQHLKEERAEIFEKVKAIEQFVRTIDDPEEKAICNLHYILGKTWEETCMCIRRHKSYAIIMDHDRNWWAENETI